MSIRTLLSRDIPLKNKRLDAYLKRWGTLIILVFLAILAPLYWWRWDDVKHLFHMIFG